MTGLPERVRAAAAEVAALATLVRVDHDALAHLARTIDPTPPAPYPEEQWAGPAEERVAGIVAWNTVNFGSGWFPHVRKLRGRSGARTLATHWQAFCAEHGVPSAEWMAEVPVEEVAGVFGQPLGTEVDGLLEAFGDAFHEMGRHLRERHDGSAARMLEAAGGSAAALAEELAALPCWDDRHEVHGIEVPLYKRAQILSSQLSATLGGHALGRFDDLDRLTAFADNLVPHVLKVHGVLIVDRALEEQIDQEELLVSGEPAEVELRAVAVHAVELLVDELHDLGLTDVTPASIDHRLWQLGQDPAVKARPRHRCRCTYY